VVSWKTSPMLRRTASRSLAQSCPATLAVPDVALARVQRILMVVVLPAPFGPRNPKVSPRSTSKSIPRTASISPYRLVRPATEITGRRPLPLPAGPAATVAPALVCNATVAASLA
jgi:hypothetical protein